MYAVSEDRPRGASTGQPGREFPVLFHLMDVSRPRAKPTPTIDSANLLSAVEQLRWPPEDESETSPPVAAATEPVAPSSAPPASTVAGVESTRATTEAPTGATAEAAVATAENTATIEPTSEPTTSAEEAPVAAAEPATPPRPAPPLVSLRKKHKTSASEDWFASHGKFIAIAFVLALVATIYFARVNRERGAVAQQDQPPQPPLIDTSSAVATNSQSAPTATLPEPTVQPASAATPAPAIASSPVELRAPQLVAESPSDKPKDNLFEFAATKNGDDRLAARPENPANAVAPSLTAPSQPAAPEIIATPAPQTAATAAGAATAETPAYPVTSPAAPQYPVSIPPAATYPATTYPATAPSQPSAPVLAPPGGNGYQPQSYQPQTQSAPPAAPYSQYSQYPVTPASMPQQQPAAQAWNAGQPAPYPSYDTTARGQRNERTGSGTY